VAFTADVTALPGTENSIVAWHENLSLHQEPLAVAIPCFARPQLLRHHNPDPAGSQWRRR